MSGSDAVADQQTLQMVNAYIVNTASMLNKLAVDTQNELDSIVQTVEQLQKQVVALEAVLEDASNRTEKHERPS